MTEAERSEGNYTIYPARSVDLNGIDLEMEPGSWTEIVGGNGSGKSTLLRIFA